MTSFTDSTVLITGGSSGIGRALAEALAAQGARVAIVGTNAGKLAEAAEAIRATGGVVETAQFDVANEAAWTAAVPEIEAKLGPVDHLFLNAGVGTDTVPIEDVAESVWRWIWEVNVMGTVYGLRTCLPGMKARGKPGNILITSSIGAFVPKTGMAPYAATKAGLVALAENLRGELEGTAIKASVLMPAAVNTQFSQTSARLAPADFQDEAAKEVFQGIGNMLQHGIAPNDVARFVLERIEAGAFYIFTHPDFRDLIAGKQAELLAAIPTEKPLEL
ncbi:short-chain dehydrogenase/reductase [Novosphingobium sp. Rr 2-17]|uniref:SDR family NAD(P)-dependent oxidoreductase n=1 Tax=Novosphingobium sp. Rr 2-17 TaxID=555793 RepID=UPI000269A4D5|nr:SDR family oxidoreductase [Novosphingobium sp. Rr 2-17]EIZ79732.1 short-chain dehydrogenase/reductase [Novosphingobium sp. Rr 2-17]